MSKRLLTKMEDLDAEEKRKLAEELGLDLEDLGLEATEKDKVNIRKLDTFVESNKVTHDLSSTDDKHKSVPVLIQHNTTGSSQEHGVNMPLLSQSLEKGISEDNRFE